MLAILSVAIAIGAVQVNAISVAQQNSPAWQRALNLTSLMTNEEKANITTGTGLVARCSGNTSPVARFNIPSLCFQDGPAGVRAVDGTSAFAAQVNAASTWDIDLIYQQALAMGAEFRGKGVNVALGPVAGGPLGRTPYNGRNWEGYGSDPYLHGIAAYHGVRGIQDNGVIATPKHFIAYEQETYRWTGVLNAVAGIGGPNPSNNTNAEQISSDLSERTLRELYLWPFEESLAAKPLAIMCSYNRINGTDACADGTLLNDLLKEELEFPGFVVSDWLSVFMAGSTNRTMNNGLDLDMPGGEGYWGSDLVTQVSNGTIAQSRLDDAVTRILYAYLEAGQDVGYPAVNYNSLTPAAVDAVGNVNKYLNVRANHSQIIRKVGEDSAVLLKNVAQNATGGLPLKSGARLAIFGTDAGPRPGGPNYGPTNGYPANSTNNGTVALGSGSGSAHFPYLIDPLAAITGAADLQKWQVSPVLLDYPANVTTGAEILNEYDAAMSGADTCLVFVSSFSGEGYDRTTLKFDNRGDQLIYYVASRCNNTVVVSHIVGVTNFEVPFSHPNVTAILNAGLPGQESGAALVSVLTGNTNPSGKLVYTILQNDNDYIPVNKTASSDPQAVFTEGLLTDYRAADAMNLPVRYPFGYGLSYTTFGYSNIKVTNITGYASAVRSQTLMNVTATVTNTGGLAGREVSQLYISFPSGSGEPPKVLRGFTKSSLDPTQSTTVSFPIRKKDIQIWNETAHSWQVPSGQFTISVGASSRNLPLTSTFVI
ncbi:Probable beta-glucosidase G [Taphrina deformans PYCC 5710]|uniref:beta-glucosidase n=1 Tax=Taphrina deformans (strain PYCC 5710 / ATCC 11124 / CBS 356.35 / IMI 108563 / JCM 9778 / NBRC 8474) TaxID=1097556 RepID=R4XB27_TAPDE|nr:Probable beta-glucosidase G [Taphrina deformans PYCC 5710]|eukprot:CCG83028.1 Probable beta-glucosidase G [Taphrina deformans PYCC 5710]